MCTELSHNNVPKADQLSQDQFIHEKHSEAKWLSQCHNVIVKDRCKSSFRDEESQKG